MEQRKYKTKTKKTYVDVYRARYERANRGVEEIELDEWVARYRAGKCPNCGDSLVPDKCSGGFWHCSKPKCVRQAKLVRG
jgi:hypothetical protein